MNAGWWSWEERWDPAWLAADDGTPWFDFIDRLRDENTVGYVETVTGTTNLIAEHGFAWGLPAGDSGVPPHVEPNRTPSGLWRRYTMLVFTQLGWQPEWGGAFEFWSADGPDVLVFPAYNRTILFEYSDNTYWGVAQILGPKPLRAARMDYWTVDPPEGASAPHRGHQLVLRGDE